MSEKETYLLVSKTQLGLFAAMIVQNLILIIKIPLALNVDWCIMQTFSTSVTNQCSLYTIKSQMDFLIRIPNESSDV